MDPYVLIETRTQRIRTSTQEDAGFTPTWAAEIAELEVQYEDEDMHLMVMDENEKDADMVG